MSTLHNPRGCWNPCDRRLIRAMSAGIDRAIKPGQPEEIPPGTPLTDFKVAALAIGCRVARARRLMKDEEFLNDLKSARTLAKEQRAEADKFLASLGREPNDIDLIELEILDPLIAHAVTKREFRRLNPLPSRSAGYITAAPAPDPPIPPAYGSERERENALAHAKEGLISEREPHYAPARRPGDMTLKFSDGSTRTLETLVSAPSYCGAHVVDRFSLPPSDLWEAPEPKAPRWRLGGRRL